MIATKGSVLSVIYCPPQTCAECGGGNWLVGRSSAECAGCGAALPLAREASTSRSSTKLEQGSVAW